jgi:hypothetical protein
MFKRMLALCAMAGALLVPVSGCYAHEGTGWRADVYYDRPYGYSAPAPRYYYAPPPRYHHHHDGYRAPRYYAPAPRYEHYHEHRGGHDRGGHHHHHRH